MPHRRGQDHYGVTSSWFGDRGARASRPPGSQRGQADPGPREYRTPSARRLGHERGRALAHRGHHLDAAVPGRLHEVDDRLAGGAEHVPHPGRVHVPGQQFGGGGGFRGGLGHRPLCSPRAPGRAPRSVRYCSLLPIPGVLGVSAPGSAPAVRSSLRMSAVLLLAGLLLGILIGAAIGYLFARGRVAAADERARAAEDRAGMIERGAAERAALVEGQLAERFQALSAQALDASTARFLEVAEGRLQAANATAAGELELRRAAVEHLVEPLLRDPGPGRGAAARVRRGQEPVARGAGRAGPPRAAHLGAAAGADAGAGHRAAAA